MRVKTDERRQTIMDAAAELFREVGFERASMAAISARLGGSKATLYSYFKSKEELFAAVMVDNMTEQADKMIGLLTNAAEDLRATLIAFGEAYLDLVLSDNAIAMLRTGMVDGNHDRLGPILYATGPEHGWSQVTHQLTVWATDGRLIISDPMLASYQLKGLLEAGMMEPRLFGAKPTLDRNLVIRSAVDGFLKMYQPC